MNKVKRWEQRQNKPTEVFVAVLFLVRGKGHSMQVQKRTTFINVT